MEFVQNVLMLQRGRKLLQRGQRELTYISRNTYIWNSWGTHRVEAT